MSPDCRGFREHLEHALAGPTAPLGGDPGGLRSLSWHEHLVGCGACRALLEDEEALEELLATLPTPRLDPGLAERVLARLARAREADDLDELLLRAPAASAPSGLAARVLDGLAHERAEVALDLLLARWPVPAPPVGLSGRVLARLEGERGLPQGSAPPARGGRILTMRALARMAAGVLLVAGAFFGLRALLGGPAAEPGADIASLSGPDAPPAGLLESLEVLESWDLITDESLEAALASFDEVDVVLFELEHDRDPLSNG